MSGMILARITHRPLAGDGVRRSGHVRMLLFFALLAAAIALSGHAVTGALVPGERALADALQAVPGGRALEPIADWMALDTIELVVLGVAALIAVRARNYPLAVSVALVLAAQGVNPALKLLIERERPGVDDLLIREAAPGFGYPSGHSSTAMLVYGYIIVVAATHLRRPLATAAIAAAVTAVALIVWDRVWDGAHWPSDTAGGLLIGGMLLSAAIALPPAIAARLGWRQGVPSAVPVSARRAA